MRCSAKAFRELVHDLKRFASSALYAIREAYQEDAVQSMESVRQFDAASAQHMGSLLTQQPLERKTKLKNQILTLKLKYLYLRRCIVKRKLFKKKYKRRSQVEQSVALTSAQQQLYEQLIQGSPRQVLVSKFSLNMTRGNICSLTGSNWLNDEVINFYMELIADRAAQNWNRLPSVYAMNTFFLSRLLMGGYGAVRRWTRRVNLFSKDIIPVPVHKDGIHWCMAIIHLRNKSILYYDSLGHSNQTVLNALEKYLQAESLDKLQRPFDTSAFRIESVTDMPRQKNANDCGVFACMTAEYICREEPLSFSQTHMDYFRKKMLLEICAGKLWR